MEEETTPEVAETEEVAATEEINDTTNDDNNEVAEATPNETPAPVSEGTPDEVSSDDDDDEVVPYQPQAYSPQPIDFSQLPADESGNVDPNAFAAALQQRDQQILAAAEMRMQDQFMQMRQEEKMWDKATKEYPEIAQNKELRQLVQQTRYGIIASGKNATPLDAAKQIFKHTSAARQAGQTQAKESIRVQRSAALETSSVQTAPSSGTGDLMNRISSPNKADAGEARRELLEKWISDGTLPTSM